MPSELISFLTTILATFLGATAAFMFGLRKASADRRAEFRRQQLTEFYSPIAGHAKRARALLAMSMKVWNAKDKGWRDVLAPYLGNYTKKLDEDHRRFAKIAEYENAQLDEELLPIYRLILDVFTSKYSYALRSTRQYYEGYYAFVNQWDRVKREALPTEVREHLPHNAKVLHEFFDHIENMLQTLQDELT